MEGMRFWMFFVFWMFFSFLFYIFWWECDNYSFDLICICIYVLVAFPGRGMGTKPGWTLMASLLDPQLLHQHGPPIGLMWER